MTDYDIKYYLKHEEFGEKEVSKEAFIKAERAAGFYPKSGNLDDCATGGFGSGGMSGTVKYTKKDEE